MPSARQKANQTLAPDTIDDPSSEAFRRMRRQRCYRTISLFPLCKDDYFMMYAKALEEVGSIDNPDAVVDALLKMSYEGVVSGLEALVEVCILMSESSKPGEIIKAGGK